MNKLLLNIFSLFILNREKRRSFRREYKKSRKYRKSIGEKIDDLLYLQKCQSSYTISRQGEEPVFAYPDKHPLLINEYLKDRENLLKNLEPEAKENCLKLLTKIEKIYAGADTLKDVYSPEEMFQRWLDNNLYENVEEKNDYWEFDGYKLPINHFEESVFISKHGIDTLKTKLSPASAIIDGGCFIADSCCVFKRNYPNNKIYAFEPTKKNYELAKKTIELNNLKDVVLENVGLGEKQENLNIKFAGSGSHVSNDYGESFACISLDEYVAKNNIKVGMIKLDVEGFEQNVIKGAITTIKTQKPIMLISIYHKYSDFFKIKPLIESWDLGYKFDFYKAKSWFPIFETLLICEVY